MASWTIVHTTSGRITSAFPQLATGGPHWSKNSHGVLGAGMGRLSANSVSGSIALLARPVDADEASVDEASVEGASVGDDQRGAA